MEAVVWVYFHSSSAKYNCIECWGPLKDAAQVIKLSVYSFSKISVILQVLLE